MKNAASVYVTSDDTITLGDGWGGNPDCIQIVDHVGRVGLSIHFSDDEKVAQLISTLTALQLDRAVRRPACDEAEHLHELAIFDQDAS